MPAPRTRSRRRRRRLGEPLAAGAPLHVMISWSVPLLVLLSARLAVCAEPSGEQPAAPAAVEQLSGWPSQAATKQQQQQQQQAIEKKVYTNQFVIQVGGGELEARKLAEKHGFIFLNHIFADYYHLEHRRVAKRATSPHLDSELEISIEQEPQVSPAH